MALDSDMYSDLCFAFVLCRLFIKRVCKLFPNRDYISSAPYCGWISDAVEKTGDFGFLSLYIRNFLSKRNRDYCSKYGIAVYADDLMIAVSPLYFLTSQQIYTSLHKCSIDLEWPVPFRFFCFHGMGYNINHTFHIKICPNIDISYDGMII